MDQDRDSKQFDPTPRRIEKAREEGNVFRSQETTAVVMLAVGVSILVVGLPYGFAGLKALTTQVFVDAADPNFSVSEIPVIMSNVGSQTILILAPFLAGLFLAAIAVSLAQSGFNLTGKPLIPKPERISPLKGLKRMFSAQGLFTFGKSLIKILVVGPISYLTIQKHMPEILVLHTREMTDILSTGTSWIIVMLFQLIAILSVLSAVDFAFEKWRYKRDLKMSKKELTDEAKEQEGDQQIKGKRREKARELAQRGRLDHAVMKSDVVVTNPTHYAVALKYDPDQSDAPVVLVKGIRKRALRIKELALEHDVPTVEDRPLARALYASVDEMDTIPEELYPAVAALLAEIYRQRNQH
ncbi:MAG: EscU/YscU/HrcU family type III secretion system export apparatus switch protein [Rhodothermales bacterium]